MRLEPAGLSAEATDLVLRRAVEMTQVEPTTGLIELSPQAVAEIAAEVGVPSLAVASALAEHQAGVSDRNTLIDRVVGPSSVWARRNSSLGEHQTKAQAELWLKVGHGLRPRVRSDGVIVANKRRGLAGRLAVGVRKAGGLGGLGRMRQVSVAAVDVDEEPGAVCMVVDVTNKREEAVLGGVAITAGGMAVVGMVALFAGPATLFAVPVVAGAGAMTSRVIHRANVRRVSEDVEATIDGIARGQAPPFIEKFRGYGRRRGR